MLVARICLDATNTEGLRIEHQAEHRAHLRGGSVSLHAAGPLLSESNEQPIGSLHILEVGSIEEARQFHLDDPYTRAGVFAQVTLARWDKRIG